MLQRWPLAAGTTTPTILAMMMAVSAIAGFVLWTANDLDTRSEDRERLLAAHVILEQIAAVPLDQESVAGWPEAAVHTQDTFDPAWVHVHLGAWMSSDFGHDRAFVLDGSDRPVYAMDNGKAVDPAAVSSALPVIAPLVARLRAMLADRTLFTTENDGAGDLLSIVDVAVLDGVPAIIGIVPVAPRGDMGRLSGPPQYLQVSVVFLDAAHAAALASRFELQDARFTMTRTDGGGQAFLPIMSREGRFVTFLEWQPDRPGQLMLAGTLPALGIGALIAAFIILGLLARLRRATAALKAGRLGAQHQATHDALTGLPNRVQFDGRLAEALNARHEPAERVALLMLDLDRFKRVNDTLGHEAGDDLIKAVGQRLREIVGNRDMLARLGADEFAVIRRGAGTEREAMQLGQRIIEAFGKPFQVFGGEAFVGVSIGIALAGDEATDRHELARKADIALCEAKAAGRNRAVVFEEPMNELLQGRHTIDSELREALRRTDQLSVVFQPLFSRETGRIGATEALVRWRHPQLGQVSPAHFMPVAEATGLIEALGDMVLRQACELGARWPGRTMAVSISPTQLRNPDFPARLFALLASTGMRAADLELAITEAMLLEEAHVISEALAAFREAGLRIALDDFGTGYSSLNYLKRYPVDRIKIGRSFVSQLAPGNPSVAIVEAMVTLAHDLGIDVTAGGIETHEQMTILSGMGCNNFQGFVLSAPVDATTIEAMFGSLADSDIARVA